MDYRIEVYDTFGRRVAVFDDTPLLEAERTAPDEPDRIRGLLPADMPVLGQGFRVAVSIDGKRFCEGTVMSVAPQWGDTRKLILDRYVGFHEIVEFEAERPACDGNGTVARGFVNREIASIVKGLINAASGAVHYTVDHQAYPDGAQREYSKFTARRTSENELAVGGIESGQWVDAPRLDASGAYAKDGDTIAGLVVDGEPWPDLRLMMIDSEETSRNDHAIARHPEVADWTDEQYALSGYKLTADNAGEALQGLIDVVGVNYVELNPHRDASGDFDDRVDDYGRYVGLVFGAGKCLNAGMVELGHADVYLHEDGAHLVPEMELKDFFSYQGASTVSVEETDRYLTGLDVRGGVFEALTMLSYAAGGYGWSINPDWAVSFRKLDTIDRVVFHNPSRTAVSLGGSMERVTNTIYFSGNPLEGPLDKTYARWASAAAYDARANSLEHFGFSAECDADLFVEGLLADVAYPEPCGEYDVFDGDPDVRPGGLVEFRGEGLRRLEPELADEWDAAFAGRLVARVRSVAHRFSGRHVRTRVGLTAPFRSVRDPLAFMVRGQPGESTLFQFRLDDATVGSDLGFHLD
ncbi:MAG: hypothetical protein GY851_07205 [bacterium]|nr:hypothetical protein [bacterium]